MNRTVIASNDAEAQRILESQGFSVRAFDTAEGLNAAPDAGQVAVVSVPPAAAAFFEQFHARSLPVPVLALGEDAPSLLEAGADAVLGRPYSPAVLRAWVMTLLRQRRRFELLSERQKELEELSRKDGLTGLFNHRWLKERLTEEFRRAQRHGEPLALLMIDLDEFKLLNDRLGHPFGDRVLRVVAELITRSVRETDLCARYGGEEFAVLLPRSGLNGALTAAERIWSGANELTVDGEKIALSIGVSVGPSVQIRGPDMLLRAADEALYRAKREGRNRICIDPQTQLRNREVAQLG